MRAFDVSAFREGIGFDGSSIRGFQKIDRVDMLLSPTPRPPSRPVHRRADAEPDLRSSTQPGERASYSRDPRFVARKAEAYLKSTGIADTAYFGPEAEFFVFDDVRFGSTRMSSRRFVDSAEAHWNTGRVEDADRPTWAIVCAQGRLLPRLAQRHAARPAHRDGPDDGSLRHRRRGASPRGRDRRPVRDRHALRLRC